MHHLTVHVAMAWITACCMASWLLLSEKGLCSDRREVASQS